MSHSGDQAATKTVAGVLRRQREDVVSALVEGATHPRPNRFDDPPAQFRQRVGSGVDLLIGHLEGRPDFGALYAGQRNHELFELEKTHEENLAACRDGVDEDRAVLRGILAPQTDAEALAAFEHAYEAATAGLGRPAARHVRTLFIGDCLFAELMSFLVGPLMNEGLSIDPFPVNARDAVQLRRTLDKLATQHFDVVFFSPFSHARVPELEALMNPARPHMPKAEIDALVSSILDQTRDLLDALAGRFECPIFIHNAGLIPRAGGMAKARLRLALTHRARSRAEERINRWLADYVALRNTASFTHLFVLDEMALVRRFGRAALGQYLNTTAFQHATVLSQRLAPEYLARIGAVGHFLGRKLVVCDLDNSLWDGVIGEGRVQHFEERQRSLKRLKDDAGVVLSIASKNDPANVNFDGGVLAMRDFVAPQISWNQKSAAIARIRETLNLQTRHMVFLDDRSDERALVQEAFPDVLTLDPGDPHVWKCIDLWADMAHGSSDIDRTRLYQEQALRDAATGAPGDASADGSADTAQAADSETLKKLGLVISIRSAKSADLKRVAELVNRTNQWNLCGTRTSFEQVRGWHQSATAQVLLGTAADRFGDMGTVCVAVVTWDGEHAEIPVFVLSCRVFGYGVESAMLSEIARRCAIGSERTALVGHYRSNTQNHPCRAMYADHGFTLEDGAYRWAGAPPLPSVPWAELRALS